MELQSDGTMKITPNKLNDNDLVKLFIKLNVVLQDKKLPKEFSKELKSTINTITKVFKNRNIPYPKINKTFLKFVKEVTQTYTEEDQKDVAKEVKEHIKKKKKLPNKLLLERMIIFWATSPPLKF